jgi:DNA-binding CsgD family transcriptional regulator
VVIVGRTDEQSVLRRLVARARDGAGGCLIVRGEPGIGKTTLLDDLVSAADIRALTACGHEWEADLAYVALADVLKPLLGDLDRIPRPQAAALASALGVDSAASDDRVAIEVAATNLLRAACEREPLLLVVDDLHWIDTASRDVLLFVARRASTMSLALVAAARDDELTPAIASLPSITLDPLIDQAAVSLLQERASGGLVAPVARVLVEFGGGNPLALQELLDGLSQPQRDGRVAIVEPINVSSSAVLAFRRRVDGLPESTRKALLVAAAEGRGRVDRVLPAMRGLGYDADVLEPAERSGVVAIVDGVIEFRHPMMRSVVHQTASPALRRSVHAALAEVEPDQDRRAWHLSASVVGPDAAVCEALSALGQRALARGADSTAAQALSRAAELSEVSHSRGTLYAKAARAANRGGDVLGAKRLLDQARPLIEHDPLARADLVLLEADLTMRDGEFDHTSRNLAREAEVIAGSDRRRAMTMLLFAAKGHVYKMECAAGLAAVERALELTDDPPDLLSLTSLSMTQAMAGHPGATATALRAAETGMASPRGHLHALGIAWPLIWLEQFEVASRFLSWAIEIQREGSYHSFLPLSLLPQAEFEFRTGDLMKARSTAAEAVELFGETNQLADVAIASGVLARIEAAVGDERECCRQADLAFAGARTAGLRTASAFAAAALGQLALAQAQTERAAKHLHESRAIGLEGGVAEAAVLQIHADLVEALVSDGRLSEANEVADELAAESSNHDRPLLTALALRCRSLVGGDEALDDFAESLVHHQRSPAVFERARTELCFASRLARNERPAEAIAHVTSALDGFRSVGALRWAARARTELRSYGVAPTPSAALTVRESQVAQLVASGASNREAAEALYVNAKTVEFHLANVYRKLGVRTRTELALAWRDDGESAAATT